MENVYKIGRAHWALHAVRLVGVVEKDQSMKMSCKVVKGRSLINIPAPQKNSGAFGR